METNNLIKEIPLPVRLQSCLLIFLSLTSVLLPGAGSNAQNGPSPPPQSGFSRNYSYLIEQLQLDGFDRNYLISIFSDPRARFLKEILFTNLTSIYREADYSHFTSPRSVRSARQFLAQESAFLNTVEKRFQVEKEIIVSILFIESSLGKRTGNNTVFNVFSTLALAARPEILTFVSEGIVADYPHVSRADIEQRARKKSKWAYQELKSLLTIARQESLDALQIKGSWAGAFGIPQFLPSSYLQYALDGNNDGKVRLHNRYDAILSAANYLREHGWTLDASASHKREIIRKYNNSRAYTDAVVRLSRLIGYGG